MIAWLVVILRWSEDSTGSDDESHGLLVSCFPITQTCIMPSASPERGREEIRAAHDGDLDDVAGKVELEIRLEGLFNERRAVECIGIVGHKPEGFARHAPCARPAAAALRE